MTYNEIHMNLGLLLEYPLSLNISVLDDALREPPKKESGQRETRSEGNSQLNLLLRVLNRITPVAHVSANSKSKITADRPYKDETGGLNQI